MKTITTEIKWAVIFTLVMLSWMFAERMVGLHDQHIDLHSVLTNLFAIPAILVYVFALRDKRQRDLQGVMTWRQGMLSGSIVSIVVALLAPGTQWFISTVISPHYFDNVIAYSVATGYHASREEAEAYFNLGNYMIQSVVGALIMGLVTTAIVAVFVRTKHAASGMSE